MNDALIDKNRLEGISSLIFLVSCLVFRIRIGNIGIGYLLTCFMFYETMWVIFGDRISDVVGKILRSKLSKNKFKSAGLVWRYSFSMDFFTGILIFLIMGLAGSYMIKDVFKAGHGFMLIWIFAGLLFLRLMSETIGGFLCSRKSYVSTFGVSYIIRQIGILVFGNIAVSLISSYGEKVSLLLKQDDISALYSCFAISLSALLTEMIVFIFLLVMKLASKQKNSDFDEDLFQRRDNTGNVFVMVWKRRIFEVISQILVILPFAFGIFLVYFKSEDQYQALSGLGLLCVTVIIPGLIFAYFGQLMLMPLVFETTSNIRQNKMRPARNIFQTGFHMCFIYGSFGCMYLIAEGKILSLLFSESAEESILKFIVFGALISVLIVPSLYIQKLLIHNGYILYAYLVQIPSDIIFIITVNIMTKRSGDVVFSFAVSLFITFICKFIGYLVLALIKLDMSIDPVSNVLVPVLVAAVVCVLNVFISQMISPHLGNIFTLIISLVEMVVFYVIILLLGRNFKENELKYLPGGRFINSLGQTLHVL